MGTTSPKGLRYPEPTTLARTLHTRIKELADDTNALLVGLDSKTDATNNLLSARGFPTYRYGSAAGVFTFSPNDGVNRTISQHTDQFYVHPSANYIQVSLMQASYCGAAGGAACSWSPLVSFGNSGWLYVNGAGCYVHNQQNPALDMGFHVTGMFNAQPYRGMTGSVATNCANDATSAGWLSHGHLFWSVTSFT